MVGLASILSHFHIKFTEFNNTEAHMLDSIYHVTVKKTLISHFWHKYSKILPYLGDVVWVL